MVRIYGMSDGDGGGKDDTDVGHDGAACAKTKMTCSYLYEHFHIRRIASLNHFSCDKVFSHLQTKKTRASLVWQHSPVLHPPVTLQLIHKLNLFHAHEHQEYCVPVNQTLLT